MANPQKQPTDPWSEEHQKEVLRLVFQRAAEDETFRQLALANGPGAIFQATGTPLPPKVHILFVEDDQYNSVIRLPPRGRPVTEKEIDEAGGCTGFSCLFLSSM